MKPLLHVGYMSTFFVTTKPVMHAQAEQNACYQPLNITNVQNVMQSALCGSTLVQQQAIFPPAHKLFCKGRTVKLLEGKSAVDVNAFPYLLYSNQ